MKSKILSIALIATLTACVLTACGDKTSETSVSSVASTNIGSDESRSDEEVAKEIKTSDAYEVSEVKLDISTTTSKLFIALRVSLSP